MQDKLKDNKEDYNYLTHEDWCDLLSTADIRDNRKRAETQIKKIATSMNLLGLQLRIRIGMVSNSNSKGKISPSITVYRSIAYFVRKQELPSESTCHIVLRTVLESVPNHKTITYGLGGPLGSRSDSVKQYKKY